MIWTKEAAFLHVLLFPYILATAGLQPVGLNITNEDIRNALVLAEETVRHRFEYFQPQIYQAGAFHKPGSPAWFMSVSHKATDYADNVTWISLLSEETTQILAQKFQLNREQIAYALPNLDIRNTRLDADCPVKTDFPCQPRKYRAYNGFCNNVQHPRWGVSNTRYLRYLMPNYADGVSSSRMGTEGDFLPSARQVSLGVHKDSDRPHTHLHLLAFTGLWAEFVAKDISHTAQFSGFNKSAIKCCGIAFDNFHADCYPIRIDVDDPHYSKVGDNCQEYMRSSVAPRIGCTLGPREQINQVSSYLDASMLYGSGRKKVDEIRLFQNGLLRTQVGPGGELLPPSGDTTNCRQSLENFRCFKSGDARVNEHIGISALQTLWMREHNRIVRQLSLINPHWTDEILFQEGRRIVIAEIQHITYNEFLPVVLGQQLVSRYELRPSQASGFYTGYDINTNPGLLNGVASAALWFFASLMPKSMPLYDSVGRKVEEKDIAETFYAPFDLYRNGILDQILRGLLRGRAQMEDQFINDVMTNRMFEDPETGLGLDLAAQLIQQGRDHGIPSYIYYREFCGLGKVGTFSELKGSMPDEVVAALVQLYKLPEDIDLFTGGLAEYPQEGAVVGPTFGCLLGIQFQKLRKGDRFWYENDLPPSAFTLEQLQEIRKTSLGKKSLIIAKNVNNETPPLARIVCDNSNALREIQPNVFLDRDPFLNAPMHCDGDAIRHIDLKKWYNEIPQRSLPNSKLRDAIYRAQADIAELHSRELDLTKRHEDVDPLSPAGTASAFNKPKNQALEIANASFLLQFATERFLSESGSLQDGEDSPRRTREIREILRSLQSIEVGSLTELPKNQRCGEHDLPCDHTSIFRSISGWCNNLQDPNRGKAFQAFKRMLSPKYNDGLKEPRSLSINGSPLPSPRLVSTAIHDDISIPHVRYTLLLMQYAQLLDHDLTHTPMNRGFDNSILDCHSCDSATTIHSECLPIRIPPRDPYFPQFNSSTGKPFCLPFTRSLPGQLTLGYREQLNQVTAYVDASFVYGSDICEAKKLRSFTGGKLNTTKHPEGIEQKELLPQTPSHPECKAGSGLCFEAGDLRVSEQPVLAAIHTIWLREHNRLAEELSSRNPHWNDELLYQHARRILSSLTQHITYSEFLPRILGWDAIHKFGLELVTEGYATEYREDCDATIFNEFASAAFRFGHSLLKPSFKRMSPDLRVLEPSVQLRHTFFNPDLLLRSGMIDELMIGLANTPMETLDSFITEEVTNHLFEDKRRPVSGMDLAALNIQRARDHGIGGYNEYRALCNLTKARNFDDLRKEISPRLIQKLKKLYNDVEDIDLFPGGLAEAPVSGGIVGPTFACIIGKQFQSLRQCDRFWYENSEPLTRFTGAQLAELRKGSLAKIICDNGDGIRSIQRSALDVPESFLNPQTDCNSLPVVDLDLWKDRIDCQMKGQNITVGSSQRVSPCVMCTCTKEGPLCQSMKINNCIRLSRLFTVSQIFDDHVCKVQCAFLIPRQGNLI